MSACSERSMPIIDYRQHPAFDPEDAEPMHDDAAINEAITTLDSRFVDAKNTRAAAAAADFATCAAEKAVELARLCGDSSHWASDTFGRVRKAIDQAAGELTAIVNYLSEPRDLSELSHAESDAVATQIAADGIAVTHISDRVINELRDTLRHEIDEVRRMAARNPRDRRSLPLQLTGKPWETQGDCAMRGSLA